MCNTCVWGRDQGISTCLCRGGIKELIHVCVGDVMQKTEKSSEITLPVTYLI